MLEDKIRGENWSKRNSTTVILGCPADGESASICADAAQNTDNSSQPARSETWNRSGKC